MIQFNLLPDIKQQFIKARRTRQLMMVISFGVGAASLAVLLLMIITVDVVQKKSLHDLNADVTKYSSQLKAVPDLDKILTVQNQLTTITGLHDQKPATTRLFTYIAQLTPTSTTISKLDVDFTANTFSIDGEAPTLDDVNSFVDTLKATTYKIDSSPAWAKNTSYTPGSMVEHNGLTYIATAKSTSDSSTEPGSGSNWTNDWKLPNAFSSVILASFGRDSKGATYTLTFNFDPLIFNNANDVALVVPNSTGSSQAILFQKQAAN